MRYELDLIGIKCPLNWAKAKVTLSGLVRGDRLELLVDDEDWPLVKYRELLFLR